jgi:hypothetical protein
VPTFERRDRFAALLARSVGDTNNGEAMSTDTKRSRSMTRWGLVLLAGVAASQLAGREAHATTKFLSGFPFYQQTESNWCAIAAAEMILGYYGSSIQQCEGANYDFGRSDCCSNPGSSACNPGTGSFTGTPLSYYGVSWSQPGSQLSYAQFTAEIDAGRPVSIGYNWNNGGGHALNVSGYDNDSGSQWMYIDDPGSTGPYWITYTTYVGGPSPAFDHTAQLPLYNIRNSPICPSDYIDIPGSQVQQCFDTWTHRARQPVTVVGTNAGGTIYYSGSFQPSTGIGWAQWVNQNSTQYQNQFNSYASQGWRPDAIELVWGGSDWRFNSIWRPAEGGFVSYTGMSLATLNAQQSSLSAQGYVPVDLSGNDSGGTPFFNATWVYMASSGQSITTNITGATYSSMFNTMAAAGKRPARVSAYNNGGTTNYAVLWQSSAGLNGFASYIGQSQSGFVSLNNSLNAQGFRLKYISANNNVFNGNWTAP